jgi:hypothetical protein
MLCRFIPIESSIKNERELTSFGCLKVGAIRALSGFAIGSDYRRK